MEPNELEHLGSPRLQQMRPLFLIGRGGLIVFGDMVCEIGWYPASRTIRINQSPGGSSMSSFPPQM